MKRLICLALLCSIILCGCRESVTATSVSDYVLIDPGHGGFDGGTVAQDGTCEKNINLEISLCLRDMLLVCGVPIEMTRTSDAALADTKVEDMRQRLSMYDSAETVISIHQNHFSSPQYRGTQTFYSPNNEMSKPLADAVQNAVVNHLQPHNMRPVKSLSDGVFLMKQTKAPAVLVECGFLSNPEELIKLKTADYRQALAMTIVMGYWTYKCQK